MSEPDVTMATRIWIEMVGALHQMGYGRLRLACSIVGAGPGPVWFGDVAPVTYFRRDNGAILATPALPERINMSNSILPNAVPMFSSRRARNMPSSYPWEGFIESSAEEAAVGWLSQYSNHPELTDGGKGEDAAYVEWYSRMLAITEPRGIIAASSYGKSLPGYLYVHSAKSDEIDRIELPPGGEGT